MEDSPMKTLPAGISSQCRRTDRLLWEAHARSKSQLEGDDQSDISREGRGRGRLVFPRYAKKKGNKKVLRVSEQEARFAFIEALCKRGQFRYSVETPTEKCYQFSGQTPLSAQTDLSVYEAGGDYPICNVEFKEGGWSTKGGESNRSGVSNKSSVFPIYKDVQKLLRERPWGLWFHLLESTNSDTICKFLGVIGKQVDRVQREFGQCAEAPGLTLHVCVLKHGFSLQKDVRLPIDAEKLEDHLDVCLRVSQTPPELREVKKLNGWKLNPRKPQS